MRRWLQVLALVACLPALPCHAIDPGVARGFLRTGFATTPLAHAYAYLHQAPKRRAELRIAIVDREVPQESVAGAAPLPIEELAREDKVRGILLRFDPSNRRNVVVTLLEPAQGRGQTLVSAEHDSLKKFAMGNNRVLGELEQRAQSAGAPAIDYRVQFSAPLFRGH